LLTEMMLIWFSATMLLTRQLLAASRDPAAASEHKQRHTAWDQTARAILQRLLDVRNGLPAIPTPARPISVALSKHVDVRPA
jgi:hypothetical protein